MVSGDAAPQHAAMLRSLPEGRSHVLDPPDELSRLAESHRIVRFEHADGTLGWLILDYAYSHQLLNDPRMSSRQDLRHGPVPHARVRRRMRPAPPGFFLRLDPPEHIQYRKHVAGMFSKRRIRDFEPYIAGQISTCLDDLVRLGPPADLVSAFAAPVCLTIMCKLIGVPETDGPHLAEKISTMLDLTATADRVVRAEADFRHYLEDLAATKRRCPGEDLTSELMLPNVLTDQEVSNIMQLVLAGGFETTANMLSLGVFALLCHPPQLTRVIDRTVDNDNVVEELLRYLSISQGGINRTVLEDIELDGQLLRPGEPVTVHIGVANRDPRRLGGQDSLDLGRLAVEHLSFGQGLHMCLGQHLARLMLGVSYRQLFDRFRQLRLAIPLSEVRMRQGSVLYGVTSLPVKW